MKETKVSNDYAQDESAGRMPTGIKGLDEILNGGLPSNRLYVIEGDSGTGKTTLGMQFLLEGVRRNEPVLYITLSETKEELREIFDSHGWSMDGLNIYELTPSEKSLSPEEQYTIFHPSEVELSDTTNAILEQVDRIKPKRLVFDSLSEMRLLARDALRYRRQILALKQFFVGRQCTVLLLDDQVSADSNLQVESIAHGVISLEHLPVEFGIERRRVRIIKLRGSRFRGGYHDFKIESGGDIVFPRVVAADHRRPISQELVSSGLPMLDQLVGGGLKLGTSTLILGPAGCGKSSIAQQFTMAAAARGERAAIYIFDEGLDAYLTRAEGLGMKIRPFLESGLITVQQIDPAEMTPGEFTAKLQRVVEQDNARLAVIDSLNGYLHSMPEERFLTVQMHELLTYLNQSSVATILVMAQHGLMSSYMGSPVDLSYLADTVLLLRYFEARGEIRKAISALKHRTGFHETTIREMSMSSKGILIGEPLTEFHGVLTGVPTFTGNSDLLAREPNAKPKRIQD